MAKAKQMQLKYKFVDPIFGRETQARFHISKVFIYGNWYGETWEDKERAEYWIRLKGKAGEAIELVFPSFEARNKALENIVPDRPLDPPITDPYIERINENFTKPTKNKISKKAVVGIAAAVGVVGTLIGAWVFRNKKPASK
jgi:hypothetical protein